jgi:predicted acyltransferase
MNYRSSSLDALRGLAIIGMVFSGTIAESLPAWMYHAQVGPRSDFNFDPSIYGISWVDLVFPFFLFAMGAAYPLALSRKLDNGVKVQSLFPAIIKRTFLLVLFAIAIYHTTPYRVGGQWNYALALLAFGLFFISFVRLPKLTERTNAWLNWIGIVMLICLIAFNVISQPDVFRQGFKLSHNDIIILLLANMALFGAFSWIFTRTNLLLRIGIMVFFFAFRLTFEVDGSWNQLVWNFNPAQWLPENIQSQLYLPGQWLYQMTFLKYLFIIIPGTIAGDLLVKWLSDDDTDKSVPAPKSAMWSSLTITFVLVLSNLICLFSRFLVMNLVLNIVYGILLYFLLRNPKNALSRLYYSLLQWAIAWLLLGTVFETFEGGIRKDDATMSYFFVTAGLAIFTLIFFSIIMDYFGNKKIFRYLTESGQNPMVAYVAGTFLVIPIFAFVGLLPHINKLYEITPWFGLLKGLIITGGMMAVTVFTVRRKWFWKT